MSAFAIAAFGGYMIAFTVVALVLYFGLRTTNII